MDNTTTQPAPRRRRPGLARHGATATEDAPPSVPRAPQASHPSAGTKSSCEIAAAHAIKNGGRPAETASCDGTETGLDTRIDDEYRGRAIEKYSELSLIDASSVHILRLAAFLSEIEAAPGSDALQRELMGIRSMWSSTHPVGSPAYKRQEAAYEWNSELSDLLKRWDRENVGGLLEEVGPSFTPLAVRSWSAIADGMRAVAEIVNSATRPTQGPIAAGSLQ